MGTRFLKSCNQGSRKGLRPAILAAFLALLPTLGEPCAAQTVNVVYTFTGNGASAYPVYVTPAQGRDSKLYATTSGQTTSNGEAFRTTVGGVLVPMHVFDLTNGSAPFAGVLLSTDGFFYGTTAGGGSAGEGVLYRLSSSGTFSVLHEFTGGGDGAFPTAAPIEGSDGSLYGTTSGTSSVGPTVYRYDRSGNFTTLVQLQQNQGAFVVSPLLQATDGQLYGVANAGGTRNCGSVFKVTTLGVVLFVRSFPCGIAGSAPNGPLVQGSDGNLYGTTNFGGTAANQYGTIFRMSQNGILARLYSFQGSTTDGAFPAAGLVQATDGNLYGVTESGGAFSSGTLFRISASGAYALLHSFTRDEAFSAEASLVQDTSGLLYGTSTKGGTNAFGTVYSLDMGLGPFITFVLSSGKAGQSAQILGQGLTGSTGATFNGIAATTFKVVNDTFMTAVVPSGATTGPVVVTTPGGTLTSNVNFRILQ